MNKLIAYSVRCCLAASAALLSATPAHSQQASPVMAAARRRVARGGDRHGAAARGKPAGRADRGLRVHGRSAAHAAGRGPRGTAGNRAQPQSRPGSRLREQRECVHPRHRPAGRAADLRSRCRHLPRRRLYRAHPGCAVQPVRRAARRGAARPAGHAVRKEHDRRRGQADLEDAAGRVQRHDRARLRELRLLHGQGIPWRPGHRQLRGEHRRRLRDPGRHHHGSLDRSRLQRHRHAGGSRHSRVGRDRRPGNQAGRRLHAYAQCAEPRISGSGADAGRPGHGRGHRAATGPDQVLELQGRDLLHR